MKRSEQERAELLEQSKRTNAGLAQPELPPINTVRVGDIDVAHRDVGHSEPGEPTYVLVHGLGGSLANWEPVVPFLAEHARVLTPDLAGFGRTTGPVEKTGVEGNVELLIEYCEVLGLHDVVLVGNSMGGMISALTAARKPAFLTRIVLIDPVLPLHPRTPPHWQVALAFGFYMVGPAARAVIPRYASRLGLERLGSDGVLNVVADPNRVPQWVINRGIEETLAHAEIQDAVPALVRAAQSIVLGASGRAYRRTLTRIPVPVTLIHGDRDHLVNVGAARTAARLNPNWLFIEGDGVGHVPMFEVAQWVAAIIQEQP